ncbi:NAD-dependent epimerase/dehydratase family protein [Helicobacter suis]|uniref:NAD-dependent epimerase/dehydratase family protein n=1 Tax=Helicobacter suis TaxID=104628 RepID=UPI0013D0B930|nr:NAD-dependent epimerase/dehydratase family protein [Helicobacter suis]
MPYIPYTLENTTIVITGGAGFIGSNLAMYFQKHHPKARVIVLDKFRDPSLSSLGHFKNLIGFEGQIITADIIQDLSVLEEINFNYLFHLAAISNTTCLNQELVMQTNHQAFLKLLKIAQNKGARVIYASSAAVYGNTDAPNQVGLNEVPENVYGFSKLCMDRSTLELIRVYENEPIGLPHYNNSRRSKRSPYRYSVSVAGFVPVAGYIDTPIIGLRYFNVYGPGEFYKGKTASMILQLGLQALQNKEVKLFEFGEQQRDFVYIEDVIQASVKAMVAIDQVGVYNVGYGKSHSYNTIIEILQQELGDFKTTYIKNPYAFFQNHTCADIQSTHKDLDYTPNYDLVSGIKAYLPTIKKLAKANV